MQPLRMKYRQDCVDDGDTLSDSLDRFQTASTSTNHAADILSPHQVTFPSVEIPSNIPVRFFNFVFIKKKAFWNTV